MQHTDTRTCETCDEVIPRGTPYRVGHATPDALAEARADSIHHATFTITPDGLVHFELCLRCWREMGEQAVLLPEEKTDLLQ